MSDPDARSGRPSRPAGSFGGGDDGANQVWGLISTLVAGPAVWGAIGYGVDAAADTQVFTPLGVVIGFVTSFYIVYVRTSSPTPGPSDPHLSGPHPQSRSEFPPREVARPDTGDVR